MHLDLSLTDFLDKGVLNRRVDFIIVLSAVPVINYQNADDIKFSFANFPKKMLSPSYIILRIQRLNDKQCRSR